MHRSSVARASNRRTVTGSRLLPMVLGAVLVSACEDADTDSQASPLGAAKICESGATVAWNQVARDLVAKHSTGAAPAMRVYALVSVAQYNAIVGAEEGKAGPRRPSPAMAVAGASAAVLTYIYPAEMDALENRVKEQAALCAGAGNKHKDPAAGEQIGREVAVTVIARAVGDKFFEPFTGTVPTCPGCWRAMPTPPAFATLGQAKTFFLTSGDQFRPPPPPEFGSPAFVAALAEVRQISDTRTAAQEEIAKRWSLQGGTVTPLGYWNVVASDLITRQHVPERRAALILALVNMAGYDTLVASHEAKYVYWLIRPTQADPAITLPIALPSFPSYPSNHAAVSGAAAAVLGAMFPQERKQLEAAAEEAGISRIYGGIHYRFDSDAGLTMGRAVAALVLAEGEKVRGALPLK